MIKDYSLDQIESYKEESVVNSKVGLTGFITPQGEFYECEYKQHHVFAETMYAHARATVKGYYRNNEESYEEFLNRVGYIALGSKGVGYEAHSHIRFPGAYCQEMCELTYISDAQMTFFDENMKRLDEVQQHFFQKYAQYYRKESLSEL